MDGSNIIGYKSSFVDQDIRWVMDWHEAGAIKKGCSFWSNPVSLWEQIPLVSEAISI